MRACGQNHIRERFQVFALMHPMVDTTYQRLTQPQLNYLSVYLSFALNFAWALGLISSADSPIQFAIARIWRNSQHFYDSFHHYSLPISNFFGRHCIGCIGDAMATIQDFPFIRVQLLILCHFMVPSHGKCRWFIFTTNP